MHRAQQGADRGRRARGRRRARRRRARRSSCAPAKNGVPPVTDGSFPESKEFLAGYWIVDVDKPERAYEIAAKASSAPGPGGAPLIMPDRSASGHERAARTGRVTAAESTTPPRAPAARPRAAGARRRRATARRFRRGGRRGAGSADRGRGAMADGGHSRQSARLALSGRRSAADGPGAKRDCARRRREEAVATERSAIETVVPAAVRRDRRRARTTRSCCSSCAVIRR